MYLFESLTDIDILPMQAMHTSRSVGMNGMVNLVAQADGVFPSVIRQALH